MYDSTMDALMRLSYAEIGEVLVKTYLYKKENREPEFTDEKLWLAWDFVKPLQDRDKKNYVKRTDRGTYAAYVKYVRGRGCEPVTYAEWEVLNEEERKQIKLSCNDLDVWLSNTNNNTSTNSNYKPNYNSKYTRTAAGAASRYGADANGDYDPMIKKAIAQRMAKRKQEFVDDGIDDLEEEF